MARPAQSFDFFSDTTTGDDAAYSAGDQVGGASSTTLQWLTGNADAGLIKSCVVTLAAAAGIELDIVIYNSAFTAGTNNAAFAEVAGDKAKCLGLINVPALAFKSLGGGLLRATVAVADMPYKATDGTILYGNIIARGALDLVTDFVVVVGLGVVRG